MATITTAIRIQDAMTPAFHSINNALNIVLSSFEEMQATSSKAIDAANIQDARQELANANAAIIQVEQNIKKVNQENDKMPNKFEEANNSANKLLKTLMGFSIFQKVGSLVTGQIGSAIQRMDTLNNYPKVMSNLGIDEGQAKASKQMMVDKLKGLPTTLNDAVSAVQRFTSANGNIGASTKMFLALNNAILAGGGTTQVQQSALEQLSQAYAKGKPDAMEWRSAITAMPAQLNQVATAMGYTSTAVGGDLYEAIQSGKVSMNDFMNTFIRLNEEGINGFQNFEEQARNATGGFATSIENMKSAVTRGITNIIDNINNALEKAGLPTIQIMIQNVGNAIETVLSTIGDYIGKIIEILSPVLDIVQNIYNFIKYNWTIIEPILQAIVIVLGTYYMYTLLAKIGTQMLEKAFKLLTNPMFWVMLLIIAVVAVLIYLWNTNDKVAKFMIQAWDALVIGAMALKLGAQTAFYAIIVAGLYMYQGFLTVKMGMIGAFYSLKLGALALELGFNGVCEGIVNAFIWMYNGVVELLNKLGGKFETMNYVDFTSETVNAINDTMSDYANAVLETYGQMEDTNGKIAEYQAKLNDVMNNGATEIQNKVKENAETLDDRVANRKKLTNINVKEEIDKTGYEDILNNLNDNMNTVAENTGNTAGNTGDIKNGLDIAEEDIKYLRDIAERDTINRFTTVPLTINLTNNNSINGQDDIDGIVDQVTNKLTSRLEAELEYVSEGIHV